MCWNKESSLIGFILNIIIINFHKNSKSNRFIPLFITVALTQLFDFYIYSNYPKKIFNKLLSINISLQILFLYYALELPTYYYFLYLFIFTYLMYWYPYINYKKAPLSWNESKNIKYYLWLLWIIIPLIYSINKKNKKNIFFLISASLLLFTADLINFGSLGKNWCMLGLILNIITYYIYN